MGRDSPIVYICSPYSGDVEKDTEAARQYCRYAADRGFIPLAPHLLFPQFLSEETERELAIRMDLKLLAVCGSLWVCGERVSEGMHREIEYAKAAGIEIRYVKEDELNVCSQ